LERLIPKYQTYCTCIGIDILILVLVLSTTNSEMAYCGVGLTALYGFCDDPFGGIPTNACQSDGSVCSIMALHIVDNFTALAALQSHFVQYYMQYIK